MNRMKKFMAMLLAVVLVAQSGFVSAAEEVTSENPISVVSNVSDDTEQSAEEVEQPEDVEQPENTDDKATDASDEGAVVPETPADASDSQNEPPSGEENPVQPSDDAQGNDAESEATDEDGVDQENPEDQSAIETPETEDPANEVEDPANVEGAQDASGIEGGETSDNEVSEAIESADTIIDDGNLNVLNSIIMPTNESVEVNNLRWPGNTVYVSETTADTQDGTKDAPFDSIQDAIDAIEEAQKSAIEDGTTTVNEWETYTSYTVMVDEGEYDRFLVPHGVANITIQGVEKDKVIINTLNGSEWPKEDIFWGDRGGITIWGANVILKNITVNAGNVITGYLNEEKELPSGSVTKFPTSINTYDSHAGAGNEKDTQIVLDNVDFKGQGAGYAFMPDRNMFTVQNCSIDNYEQAIYFAGDNYVTKDCNIIGNTITDCIYAIHGYYGGSEVKDVTPFEIKGNNISGTKERFSVIAILDQSNCGSVEVDIADNDFYYTIVGCINMREEDAVVQGSMKDVQSSNTLNDYSFVVDAYYYSSDSYGTVFYAPKYDGKIATWYSDPIQVGDSDEETVAKIVEALNEYGTAGQIIELNAPLQEAFTLVKNAIVIEDYVDAGSLKVTKQIANHASDSSEFDFTIHFDRADDKGVLNGTYEYRIDDGDLQTVTLENGDMTVTLKDGQSVTIYDMLPGTQYEVTERSYSSYVATSTGASGTIVANETQEAVFTNTFVPDVTPDGFDVNVSKSAEKLNANDETTVELTVGGDENRENVAVLFLLDKSTSQGMRDEAADMLDELASKTNTNILYDVVIFSGTATSSGWQDIQDTDTLDSIKANFVNGETTSGTNMPAGIWKAETDMDTLRVEYPEYETTYLITLSDGITYVWSEEDKGDVYCVPVQGLNGTVVETTAQNGADTWSMMYDYRVGLEKSYGGVEEFLNTVEAKMENTRNEGHVQSYYSGDNLSNPIDTYIYNDEMTAEVAAEYACGPDFAMYYALKGYEELASQFTNTFAFAVPELDESGNDDLDNWDGESGFPWGREIMLHCQSISTNADWDSDVSNEDAAEIFAKIKNQILYAIESGTGTDVIGNDFDLKDLDSFRLTVGGTEVTGTADSSNANLVNFGTADENGVYPYTVEYVPGAAGEEHFVWTINVPVENANSLTLSYVLKLVNKNSEAGTYGQYDRDGSKGYESIQTNESAVLEYETTEGDIGSKTFPKPTVSYTVPETPVPEEPTAGTATLNITKKVQANNGDAKKVSTSFYASIFTDDKYQNRYGNVIELKLTDASEVTVTVNVETPADGSSRTYYVMETDKDGNVVSSGKDFGYQIDVKGSQVTVSKTAVTADIVITNQQVKSGSGSHGGSGSSGSGDGSTGSAASTPQQVGSAKTGDTSNLTLYIVLAAVAVAALGACGVIVYKKRKLTK